MTDDQNPNRSDPSRSANRNRPEDWDSREEDWFENRFVDQASNQMPVPEMDSEFSRQLKNKLDNAFAEQFPKEQTGSTLAESNPAVPPVSDDGIDHPGSGSKTRPPEAPKSAWKRVGIGFWRRRQPSLQ